MKDWPTEDEADAERRTNPWWRDRWNDLDPKHQLRDDLFVASAALFYLGVVIWPIYRLALGEGGRSEYATILGGLIGLLLAGYAVMSDRMPAARRAVIGVLGVGFIVACWGFGTL